MSDIAALKASLAPRSMAAGRGRVASLRSGAFWNRIGTRFLPFADAATEDLPLGRILRLSLFQASVGMAAVLATGTLRRGRSRASESRFHPAIILIAPAQCSGLENRRS